MSVSVEQMRKRLKVLAVTSALRKAGRDQVRQDLVVARSERDAALAALQRVRELHTPIQFVGFDHCEHCWRPWPCPTADLVIPPLERSPVPDC